MAEMESPTSPVATGDDNENGTCKAVRQASDITFSTSVGPAPGLRRKQLLWQNAVRNIIDQHNLYSLRLAGGLERGRHRIIVTDAYISDINRFDSWPGYVPLDKDLNHKLPIMCECDMVSKL